MPVTTYDFVSLQFIYEYYYSYAQTGKSALSLFKAMDNFTLLRNIFSRQTSFKRQSKTNEILWSCTLHAHNSQLMLVADTPIMQSPSMISRQTPCTHAVWMFRHPLCEPSTSHAYSISTLLNPTYLYLSCMCHEYIRYQVHMSCTANGHAPGTVFEKLEKQANK